MSHFAHYVRRELVEMNYEVSSDPWFSENQPDNQGLAAPSYHITRSSFGPATDVIEGNTIWLFSQLLTPWGMFPPALDAKIVVDSISRQNLPNSKTKTVIRYQAASGSKWFPLYDATAYLARLSTQNSAKKTCPLLASPQQPIGQALQGIRKLVDASPLLELEAQLEQMPLEFISYRLVDGTRIAHDKAMQLAKDGKAIFWDRWSLPRRLAERREFLNDVALDQYISGQIGKCRHFWIMHSAQYAEDGSYSFREMAQAQLLNKLIFVCKVDKLEPNLP